MNRLKQAHGNWVTGDRFWNREDETALFEVHIREGANLLLVAQRRMGKTSLMKEVALRLSNEYHCVFVDFQNASTPQDAISELAVALRPHRSIWTKAQNVFANILDKVEQVGIADLSVTLRAGLNAGNWSQKGDELLDILAGQDKPVLLLMDEVPILVNRIIKGVDYEITPARRQVAGEFMSWIRKNSLKHQGQVHMVISGSIGFEPVLRQADLSSTINNFVPFHLKPWGAETAEACLRALAAEYGINYQDSAEQEMTRLIGCCIPHHVQMFFDHARTYCTRKKCNTLTSAMVQEVYRAEMLSTHGHAELTHYEERLKLVLGAEKMELAIDMLAEAAITKCLTGEAIHKIRSSFNFAGEKMEDVQRDILWMLEHDGYLSQTPAGYKFVSELLRAWWESRYKLFYTPVMERKG